MRAGLVFALGFAIGCGDNIGSGGFGELVEDPAVVRGCSPTPLAAGAVRAKYVECADELPLGPLVGGLLGDVVIENAIIKLVVRASGEGYVFPGSGAGGIVDVARAGGVDGIKEIIPLAELNSLHATSVAITEAGDDGPATLTLRGHAEPIGLLAAAVNTARTPVTIETQYVLEADSEVVVLRTRLLADEGAEATPQVGDLFFFGGAVAPWLPGIGIASDIASAEFVASVGDRVSFGVSYPASQRSVQFLSIESVTGALGPSIETNDRSPSQTIERFLIVGDGSVSSVTDAAWALREEVTGRVSGMSEAGVEIVARDTADRPITMARCDASGAYSMSLPVGAYTLSAESAERSPGEAAGVTITADGAATANVAAGARGTLRLTVTDGAGAIPARAVLRRGTEQRIHFVGASGSLEVGLPPGDDWTLDVSRGVEYDAFTASPMTIAASAETAINATLNRVIDTEGWISVDTHLHSEMSLDSTIPLEERLKAVAAEGVEIAISTDHDFVTDYGSVVAALGLGAFLNHKTGVETSTLTLGHYNAWPLVRNPARAGGGALGWYGRPPGEIFGRLRQQGSDVVVQLNHPRDGSSGFFSLVDFNRDLGMATQDPAMVGFPGADFNDFNFDAVEVGNSFDGGQFREAFADYLALAAAGHPAAATGSSDSHGASAFAGKSRTFVFVGVGNDIPGTVDLAAVDAAIVDRKVSVSQGSFITAQIEDPATGALTPIGALADLSGATMVRLRVVLQAPPWMQTRELVIYRGRAIATTLLLDATATATVRFDGTIDIPIDGDDFLVALALPAGPGEPVLGLPDASFTNPILYDADGDGAWR